MSIDVPKFVGAASAPVALIIATSIFLSNLTTKWWAMNGIFRELSGEYRRMQRHDGTRDESLKHQLTCYIRRLHLLRRATLMLTLAIVCFILTVFFTGITVLFPHVSALDATTICFSIAGLLLLAISVVVELVEANTDKVVLALEMKDQAGIAGNPTEEMHQVG